MRGCKVTKRTCMAKGRTFVEAWMGTVDEVDFCPPIYPVISLSLSLSLYTYMFCETYIFSIRREGASEDIIIIIILW
jgi:hypothetical protein